MKRKFDYIFALLLIKTNTKICLFLFTLSFALDDYMRSCVSWAFSGVWMSSDLWSMCVSACTATGVTSESFAICIYKWLKHFCEKYLQSKQTYLAFSSFIHFFFIRLRLVLIIKFPPFSFLLLGSRTLCTIIFQHARWHFWYRSVWKEIGKNRTRKRRK